MSDNFPKNQRHSREGANPASYLMCVHQRLKRHWVPAFAGTTIFFNGVSSTFSMFNW